MEEDGYAETVFDANVGTVLYDDGVAVVTIDEIGTQLLEQVSPFVARGDDASSRASAISGEVFGALHLWVSIKKTFPHLETSDLVQRLHRLDRE